VSIDRDSDPDPPTSAYPDCPVVDAHVHVMPDDLFDAVYGWFRAESDWTVPELDAATVVARARERTDGFVFFPYAHRPGVAEGLNETAADWRNRLAAADVEAAALGTVHAGDDDPRTIVRDAFDRGLEGIKLHCPVQGYAPDDERLSPVYEELVARDAPLVVHASTYPFDRGNDDVHPRRLRSVLERFPDLRVCVPHLGLFETPAFLDLADE
jgi:predicted TIM-barrel fold metal-dependent hydrolase